MGWKGTIRSLKATARKAERASVRRANKVKREMKQLEKMMELERAQLEVAEYENLMETLLTVQKEEVQPVDWQRAVASSPPIEPTNHHTHEKRAQDALVSYRPGFWVRLFKMEEKQKQKLKECVDSAINKDRMDYEEKYSVYESDLEEWTQLKEFASRILNADKGAFAEAVREMEPFAELKGFGTDIKICFHDSGVATATFGAHGEDIIPREEKCLLKSGKLSSKTIPKSKFYSYYQDFVCGCSIRIANELLAILPLDGVLVNVVDDLLDPATGHLSKQTILSIYVPRLTLSKLNLEQIDPSECLKNFNHRISFKSSVGFSPVQALDAQIALQVE